MGNTLTDDGIRAFGKLQKRMFITGADNTNCYEEFKGLFDLSSAEGKAKLNQFLEDAKPFLDDSRSALPDGGGAFPIPDYNGFVKPPTTATLPAGTLIDRYGSPNGSYLAPVGTPSWARSLQPGASDSGLIRYRVVQSLQIDSGLTAPWFNQPGGGIQYKIQNDQSVKNLLDAGILEPAP